MQDLVVREGVSRREISGTPVYCGSPVDWVARIDAAVSRHTVCLGYVNPHTAYLLATDDDYRAACRDLTLLNDGVGLDIVSLIKYDRAFEFNLNGSDFTPYFLKTSRHRFRVFMLGGRPGVAARAAEALTAAYGTAVSVEHTAGGRLVVVPELPPRGTDRRSRPEEDP